MTNAVAAATAARGSSDGFVSSGGAACTRSLRFCEWKQGFHARYFGSEGAVERLWQSSAPAASALLPSSATASGAARPVRRRPSTASLSTQMDRYMQRAPESGVEAMDAEIRRATAAMAAVPARVVAEEAEEVAAAAGTGRSTTDAAAVGRQELRRLETFKESLEALVRHSPSVRGLVERITRTYDGSVKRLVQAATLAEADTLAATVVSLQREVLALTRRVEERAGESRALQEANAVLRDANQSHQTETSAVQTHAQELHEQLERVCDRLFLDSTPEEEEPTADEAAAAASPPQEPPAQRRARRYMRLLKRLCLEVEHLRRSRCEALTQLRGAMDEAVRREADVDAAAQRCAGLEDAARRLRRDVRRATESLAELEDEKDGLAVEAARCGEARRAADVAERRAAVAAAEVAHGTQLLRAYLERGVGGEGVVAGARAEKAPPHFVGLGCGDGVPLHLRTKLPRVKSRTVPRATLLGHVRAVWAAVREGEAGRRPLDETLAEYMAKQPGGVEYSYSFLDACGRAASTSVDAAMLVAHMDARCSPSLHAVVGCAAAQVQTELTKAAKGERRAGMAAFTQSLQKTLQCNPSALVRLQAALLLDKEGDAAGGGGGGATTAATTTTTSPAAAAGPGFAAALAGEPGFETDVSMYPRLSEAIKRELFTAAQAAWVTLAHMLHTAAAKKASGTLTLKDAHQVLSERDPLGATHLPLLAVGAGVGVSELEMHREVEVANFMANVAKRYGKVPPMGRCVCHASIPPTRSDRTLTRVLHWQRKRKRMWREDPTTPPPPRPHPAPAGVLRRTALCGANPIATSKGRYPEFPPKCRALLFLCCCGETQSFLGGEQVAR